MKRKKIELTVLLPCLNEEKTIGKCIDLINRELIKYEINGNILVADNGSVDNSLRIIKEKKVDFITVTEKGYGSALRAGIDQSVSKYTLMADSDLTYDFSHIHMFLHKIREGNDLVVGNRFKGKIENKAMPFINKYIGNPVLSGLGRFLFKTDISDFHCGMRIFETKKMQKLDLEATGMEFASEMICKAVINDFKISEIPTNLLKVDNDRVPHLSPLRDGLRHIFVMIKIRRRKK